MRRSFSFACLFVACLCANGALLDFVQVLAWARMITGYAHSLPVGEAIQVTFAGRRPCQLCLAVEKARAAGREHTPAPAPATVKLVLFCQQTDPTLPPMTAWRALKADHPRRLTRRDPVPVPPPRNAVVAVG